MSPGVPSPIFPGTGASICRAGVEAMWGKGREDDPLQSEGSLEASISQRAFAETGNKEIAYFDVI